MSSHRSKPSTTITTTTLKYDKYGHPLQQITNRPARYPPSRTLEEYERMLNGKPFFRPSRAGSSDEYKGRKSKEVAGSGRTGGLSFDLVPRIVSTGSNGRDRAGRVRFDTIDEGEEDRITPFPPSTSGRNWSGVTDDGEDEGTAPAVPPKPKMRKRYPPLPPRSPDRQRYDPHHPRHPDHIPHPDWIIHHATPPPIPPVYDPRGTSRESNTAPSRRSALNVTQPQPSATAPPTSPLNTSHPHHPHPHPHPAQTVHKTTAHFGRRDQRSSTEIRSGGGGGGGSGKAGSDYVSARMEALASFTAATHNVNNTNNTNTAHNANTANKINTAHTAHTAHTTPTKRTNKYDPTRHPGPESPIDWDREARVVRDVKGGFGRVSDPLSQSRRGKGETSGSEAGGRGSGALGWGLDVPNTNMNMNMGMGVGVGAGVGMEPVPSPITATAPIIPKEGSRELTEMEDELGCPICMCIMAKCHAISPCGHTLCGGCGYEWLRENDKCPICRTPVSIEPACKSLLPLLPMDRVVDLWVRSQGAEWDGLDNWNDRKEAWEAQKIVLKEEEENATGDHVEDEEPDRIVSTGSMFSSPHDLLTQLEDRFPILNSLTDNLFGNLLSPQHDPFNPYAQGTNWTSRFELDDFEPNEFPEPGINPFMDAFGYTRPPASASYQRRFPVPASQRSSLINPRNWIPEVMGIVDSLSQLRRMTPPVSPYAHRFDLGLANGYHTRR